jgi:hypothetical protein
MNETSRNARLGQEVSSASAVGVCEEQQLQPVVFICDKTKVVSCSIMELQCSLVMAAYINRG